MIIKKMVCGPLSANGYFISNDKGDEWALVDAPYPTKELINFATELGGRLKYILLTHCHWDHIAATNEVKSITGAKVVAHKEDVNGLIDSSISLSKVLCGEEYIVNADIIVANNQTLKLGDMEIKVMHTPGHTKGSVCYFCEDNIFSGDTLFAGGSMGRIDFPTGNAKEMINSLKNLADLDGDYNVYPGHYDKTDLDTERRTNPYM
ncbi:MAG: MBL fold metallo-hydrolase [Clostridia bacterium]|nr:MBL fold metallo-hydrolase [Clostridia bacterium]